MFGKRNNVRYTVIDRNEDDLLEHRETVDFEPMKRKFCTPSCLWSAVFTGALIGIYYIPSVGLTFYQRWLLQVSGVRSFNLQLIAIVAEISLSPYHCSCPYGGEVPLSSFGKAVFYQEG